MSDHRPIIADLEIPCVVDANTLLFRSYSLKPFTPSQQPVIKINRHEFDVEKALIKLQQQQSNIINDCNSSYNPDNIIGIIENTLIPVIKECKYTKKQVMQDNSCSEKMQQCNTLFMSYIGTLNTANNEEEIKQAYSLYQSERNNLTRLTFEEHENSYRTILSSKDDKKLWSKINWSGSFDCKRTAGQPPTCELAEHFRELYQPNEEEDINEIRNLRSNTHIPVTDEAISVDELNAAAKQMKKGGWDYSLMVLQLLVTMIPTCLLHLMNIMFFFCYPAKLCLSLLYAIPKKGNLRLVTNFRGIQMQPLLGIVYDRIIAARLILWAKINPEQTAFQKGKSTLDQVFTLRVIIALAKKYNKPLFVGFFDLSKAFDKVSRVQLLKCLVKLGIGTCILEAIKAMYMCTRCVLKSAGKLSEIFYTYSGIKQGAPSSVILFIIFMDDVINELKEKCANEFIIKNVHCLLHADDTLIMSLDYKQFVHKCNVLVNSFKKKKLSLNMSKSSYFVINPPNDFIKVPLKISTGWLPYEASVVYLGVTITDNGLLSTDVILQTQNKYKNISIKLANYITNNMYSPVTVKLKVLDTCVKAAILYSCETWGASSLVKVDNLHKKAIRTTLTFKKNTPNDILYVESGLTSLKGSIYKRQYKFWTKILEDIDSDPLSPISQIYKQAIDVNIPYIKHYQKLHRDFTDAYECKRYYDNLDRTSRLQNIRKKANEDKDGIVGTYVKVNPKLEPPLLYYKYMCSEYERLIISKYRTGGHRLKVQTGRYEGAARDSRLCKCKNETQTLEHVIFRCVLTEVVRTNTNVTNLEEFFSEIRYASVQLRAIEEVLNIKY